MLKKITSAIDWFTTKLGDWTAMLIIPLLLVVLYEVTMRYGFNSPTIWAFEMTTFLYGMHYMFGYSYTEVKDGHVRVDIFTALLGRRLRAFIGALTYLVLFMPVMVCLTIWSSKFAMYAVKTRELNSTSWAPAIYPYKVVMAVCFFLLLLQGVSSFLKQVRILFAADEEDV
jgi:TRAP-type mannitol/chloroaromatic compound transport system permease small subunit